MTDSIAGQAFLLTPMQPTPNGRMHVGHGGGTYLRADVIKRALDVRGATTSVVCGSDAYENWVLAEAHRIGRDAMETCVYYHELIRADLEMLAISFDDWIDPLADDHRENYIDLHERIFEVLRRIGAACPEEEQIPFSSTTGRATVGVWLAGRCPRCAADAQGSSCVRCGAHFQPEELRDARSRLDDQPVEWKTRQNWFVRPRDPDQLLAAAQIARMRPDVQSTVEQYVVDSGGRIRLTGPGDWGIRTPSTPSERILSNPYFLYSVHCGTVYQKRRNLETNPFDPGSDVTTIGVFGSDNTVPGLVAPAVFAQALPEIIRPFDRVVVNGMLNFEGRKCSTSKRHGIWLGELLGSTSITADELRWTLAQIPLDDGPADLSLNTLVEQTNRLRLQVSDLASRLSDLEGQPIAWSSDCERAWQSGPGCFEPGVTPVTSMADTLRHALAGVMVSDPGRLLMLSLVAAPLLPHLASALWRQLGYEGDPVLGTARQRRGVVTGLHERYFISARDWMPTTVAELAPFVHRGE